MIRLHITTEGQTEQNFAKRVLVPHLANSCVSVDARCVLTSRDRCATREYRGGLLSYEKAKKDILCWMKEDDRAECRFTTMFDLYALPQDFPGYDAAKRQSDPYQKVKQLEEQMESDLNDTRFIPYLQLHEFETLILADPQQLDWEYLEHDTPINNLIKMVSNQNPELINDSPKNAPSKRISREIPTYDKATAGVSVANKIGLQTLRAKCPHFNQWLTRLEKLNSKDDE